MIGIPTHLHIVIKVISHFHGENFGVRASTIRLVTLHLFKKRFRAHKKVIVIVDLLYASGHYCD